MHYLYITQYYVISFNVRCPPSTVSWQLIRKTCSVFHTIFKITTNKIIKTDRTDNVPLSIKFQFDYIAHNSLKQRTENLSRIQV